MKHLLNDLSDDEKNRIREQHTGGKKIVIENFNKLINTKLGDAKPLTEKDNVISESILLTLAGLKIANTILKKIFAKKDKQEVDSNFEKTGRTQKSTNGVTMIEYRDKTNGKTYWGVEVNDNENGNKPSILLFTGTPNDVQSIIDSEKIK